MSTLMRNIVAVLNKSPPALLGEVLLVDDMSSLEELSEGLERYEAVRMFFIHFGSCALMNICME